MAADPSIAASRTRFGLIRHAMTQWNVARRIQGQADSPLTDQGVADADRWGQVLARFAWNGIVASDTGRARTTAERINRTLRIFLATDARLREQNWGKWTGMTVTAVESLYARMPEGQVGTGWKFCPPGGESREQMWERGQAALRAAAARRPHATVLVVTHEGMIRCLLNRCLGLEYLASEPKRLRPYHLHWLVCRNGQLAIETINALDLRNQAG